MYLNTVPYGSNAYGIKSAARTFFNKLPSELNVQEAAMLVGVVNAPTRYSPRSNPDRALARRNTVISRMREKGYLTRAQRDSIQALPIELDFRPISHNAGTGTYFREMLRMDEFCRKVGFNDEQTETLIGGKPLKYSGTLYSETHRKRFNAENVIARIASDETNNRKFGLKIDGIPIVRWFREQAERLQHYVQPERNGRGLKM